MPGFLRQATASQSRALGPFISSSDFVTPETGLTINATDIKLVVNGAASANKNSGGGTHRVNGVYGVTFDATDTATVGEMEVSVLVSGALIVFDKFFVVEGAVYDAQYADAAPGYVIDQPVNSTKFGGTTVTGRDIGASVLLSSGTGTGQIKIASGYVAPDWGDVANKTTTNALTGTTIATSQVVASVTGAVGSVTGLTASDVGAIKAKTDNLPAAPASTTNITAGTITTVTNLTNAPTAGDFTATMKTSLNAATPAVTVSDKTGFSLSSAGNNSVADAYLNRADGIEVGLTPRQAERLNVAAAAGKLSGAATSTVVIRNAVADSKDRITATVDSSGNRTAVTTDVT